MEVVYLTPGDGEAYPRSLAHRANRAAWDWPAPNPPGRKWRGGHSAARSTRGAAGAKAPAAGATGLAMDIIPPPPPNLDFELW